MRNLLIVLLLSSVFEPCLAGLKIVDDQDNYLVGRQMYLYVDVYGQATEQEILSGKMDSQFVKGTEDVFNLGFSDAVYWLRLDINYLKTKNDSRKWLLEIGYPLLDDVTIYRITDNGYTKERTGDKFPFSQREIAQTNFLFDLPIKPGHKSKIYIRVQSTSSLQIPVKILTTEAYATESGEKLTILGAFYGIMFIMILYNFFFFIVIRNSAYLYYIIYISSFTLFLGSVNGLTFRYLWPDSPAWGNTAIPFFISFSGASATLFTKKFLNTPETLPKMDKILTFLCGWFLLLVVVSLTLSYEVAIKSAIFCSVLFVILILATGILCVYRGIRIARFFLPAWLTLLIGILIHSLTSIGMLPVNIVTLYADQAGCVLEVILLSFALADRIQALRNEKELYQKQALEALEQSNRAKDAFLATISHELRTPMNGITNSLGLLSKTSLDEEQKSLLNVADNSALNMLTLVDDILGFTESQSGKLALNEEVFDIKSLLRVLETQYGKECAEKGVVFSTKVSEKVPSYVKGDLEKLKKALQCVISNSVKFCHKGAISVCVTAESPAQDNVRIVRFKISDTGIGIDKEKQSVIFDTFNQLDSSFARQYGGLGIGLAVTQNLIIAMGGSINLESTPDLGTDVTISLPLKVKENHISQPVHSEALASGTRVLIVEDNKTNQLILKKSLEKIGVTVNIAENGQQSLEKITEFNPHLILMDCQMPVMDGFEATKEIRKMAAPYKHIPIIAVTANVMSGDKKRCLDAGMSDYLKKPVNFDVLNEKMRFWLTKANEIELSF